MAIRLILAAGILSAVLLTGCDSTPLPIDSTTLIAVAHSTHHPGKGETL